MLTGYAHPEYARSLAEYGTPMELPLCGGWLLERPVPGSAAKDAMGCYPLFACRDWSQLRADLEVIGSRLVSLALVTDPFARVTASSLKHCFDIVRPFKNHHVLDTNEPLEAAVNRHHRYRARRALKDIIVEVAEEPLAHLDTWLKLYHNLVTRHRIRGIRAFSRDGFELQLQLPGLAMIVGRRPDTGDVVGAHLVLIQGEVAYSHLAAFSEEGYRLAAAYGIYWETLRHVAAQGVRYFDIGAGAGLDDQVRDGLTQFKKGWSNANRVSYFCGRVFDRDAYDALCRGRTVGEADYFPLYRRGEFG